MKLWMIRHTVATTLNLSSTALALALVGAFGVSGCSTSQSADEQPSETGAAAVVSAGEDPMAGRSPRIPPIPERRPSFFVARADLRKCVSPLCGGDFVSQVNLAETVCADGVARPECYVAAIDLSGAGLTAAEQAKVLAAVTATTRDAVVVFAGRIAPAVFPPFGNLGKLVVREVWLASNRVLLSGHFFGLRDTGIVCITSPCPSIEETLLNTGKVKLIEDVSFSGAPGTDKEKEAARAAIFSGEGLVATGFHAAIGQTNAIPPRPIPSPVLEVTQYFRKVSRALGPGEKCDGSIPCGNGLLCCYPCGIAPDPENPDLCHNVCMPPMNGHCPLFP